MSSLTREEYLNWLVQNTPDKDAIPARRDFLEHLLQAGMIVPDLADQRPVRKGFMCKVDFDFELGMASGGNIVCGSVEDLRKCRVCVDSCGIVEVEVRLAQIVEEGTDNPIIKKGR